MVVPTAFIESWKIAAQRLFVQAEKMVLSRFAHESLLIESNAYHLTIRKTESWPWAAQDLLNHG